MKFSSLLLQRWQQAVDAHPGIIVFVRVGDFYETYAEQAEEVAQILEITLTSRLDSEGSRVPMCGVPFHSVERYLAVLLRAGRKVALYDELERSHASPAATNPEGSRIFTSAAELPFDDLY